MKHLMRIPLLLILFALFLSSCSKTEAVEECVCPTSHNPVFDSDGNSYENPCLAECAGVTYSKESPELIATIWFDRSELGSCKWFIRIKGKDYKMSNVDRDFYKDGLKVIVAFSHDLSPPDGPCDARAGYINVQSIRLSD